MVETTRREHLCTALQRQVQAERARWHANERLFFLSVDSILEKGREGLTRNAIEGEEGREERKTHVGRSSQQSTSGFGVLLSLALSFGVGAEGCFFGLLMGGLEGTGKPDEKTGRKTG